MFSFSHVGVGTIPFRNEPDKYRALPEIESILRTAWIVEGNHESKGGQFPGSLGPQFENPYPIVGNHESYNQSSCHDSSNTWKRETF